MCATHKQVDSLFYRAKQAILAEQAQLKCQLTNQLKEDWQCDRVHLDPVAVVPIAMPGVPSNIELVPVNKLSRRGLGSELGRAAFLHAIVHIEFMAINLALDAVYRFQGMPRAYYSDWVRIAAEEAHHFGLLQARLGEFGYSYGDFKAHAGLWQVACDSQHDVMVRMALVPRVMEARGLDVTPGMINRLEKAGDDRSAQILKLILHDEIDHVASGSRWFQLICRRRNLDPDDIFVQLIDEYLMGKLRGPYSIAIRKQAGFSDRELAYLTNSQDDQE